MSEFFYYNDDNLYELTNFSFVEMVDRVDIVSNDVNIFDFYLDQPTNPVNVVVEDGIQNIPSLIDINIADDNT